MSEEGWRAFIGAEGIDDWVVLHGGPTAVFRVGSLEDGARLARSSAALPRLEPQTTVTFTLEPIAGGTRLILSETGFDEISLPRRAKAHADNSQGWTEVLGWLQTYVEAAR